MPEEQFTLPTGEQMKEERNSEGFAPLPTDDYIVKVAKILLQHEPTWNATTKSFNYSKTELQYTLVCLPYKLKAEDGLISSTGKEAKPLTGWIWRKVNPFSVGQMPNGEPTFLRAFIAYAQGLSPDINTPIAMPGIVVLNKDDQVATTAETEAYKAEFRKYLNKEIDISGFTTKNAGFKHIPDISSLAGKYIGAKIVLDENGRNKITGFSKLPSSFVPDGAVEAEAMAKFEESYKKMQDKRKEKIDNSSSVSTGALVDPGELPF